MYVDVPRYDSWDAFKVQEEEREAPHIDLPGDWGAAGWGVTLVPGTGEVVRFHRDDQTRIEVLGRLGSMSVEEAHGCVDRVEAEIDVEDRRTDQVWTELFSRMKSARAGL